MQVLTSTEKQYIKDCGGRCLMERFECRHILTGCTISTVSFVIRALVDQAGWKITQRIVKVAVRTHWCLCDCWLYSKWGSKIQRPVHVKLTGAVLCPESHCKQLNSIHERSSALPRFCKHVDGAKKAKISGLPTFQVDELFLSTLSNNRGDIYKASQFSVVMYFNGKIEDLNKSDQKIFYFPVALGASERCSYYF